MRIRTIKPEFFTHEELYDLEAESGLPLRIAFAGLWCAADREGRFKWEPRRLGVQILPYDNIDFSRVLDALHRGGFVARYGGGKFGLIPSFDSHQCINMREAQSNIPSPEDAIEDDAQETHVHARATSYQYKGVNIQPKLRAFILTRDGEKCKRCGSIDDLTVDHIFPQSIGGTHSHQNLRTLCRSCNSARPVQGNALVDDLAKDGLTLDDMERMCAHVHARGEGKGREGKGKEKEVAAKASGFDFSIPPEIPESLKGSLVKWQAHRREIKKPITATAWNALIADCIKSPATMEDAINKSILSGWQGLFPDASKSPEPEPAKSKPKPLPANWREIAQEIYGHAVTCSEDDLTADQRGDIYRQARA
jgi:hypothetical protein